MKFKFIKKKFRATIDYNSKLAKRLVKKDYYVAQAKNMTQYEFLEKEKARLSTPRWEKVTKLIEHFKSLAANNSSPLGRTLIGIFNKNIKACRTRSHTKTQNLLPIVAKPETLLLAYREIRGNKGALTPAASVSQEDYNNMNEKQREIYLKSFSLPDGISLYDIHLISQLLRKSQYPWGSSARVYFDKPGQKGKKRPITIPPFTDKIVQKAIELVLQAIYEPYFELRNRSFGFRPNKGTHDAMIALTSDLTNGMRTAIEGDIEAAYDTTDKEILLEILSKRIQDRKFLNLIRNRLNYDYVETESGVRVRPSLGIPQGGIDSPYLFNIYMTELDDFIYTQVRSEVDRLNGRVADRKQYKKNKAYNANRKLKDKESRFQKKLKNRLETLPKDRSLPIVKEARNDLFESIHRIRLINHRKTRISTVSAKHRFLRIFYVRYADDWILLTNGDKEVANLFKNMISEFLTNRLKLKLSEHKTLVTDITKSPAHFLGFELRVSSRGALRKLKVKNESSHRKFTLSKKSGLLVWAQPDRQRQINKFFMKGLCSRSGFPISVPWLSTLEAYTIIDRFNASIRGCAEFLLPIIRNKFKIVRWIYILRYACLKTLAQKYRCSISKIFKRFGHNMYSKSAQTIRVRVEQKVKDKIFFKDWVLLTYSDLLHIVNYRRRAEELKKTFWERERGHIGNYPLLCRLRRHIKRKGKIPKITNDEFLETLTWVSWRTAAAVSMPCANCGTSENVQQHHLRHIRKRAYALIPKEITYKQVMALRNRKQIPLCVTCHRELVHNGKYNGPQLIKLAPTKKLIDNRIIHIESFVKPGIEYHAKSLEEKGWSPKDNPCEEPTWTYNEGWVSKEYDNYTDSNESYDFNNYIDSNEPYDYNDSFE